MSTDLRDLIAAELRRHPRISHQRLFEAPDMATQLAAALPALTPFRADFAGAIAILDWDHRLPSRAAVLRIYGYYDQDTLDAGRQAYDERLALIASRDRFPEFDVPDFQDLGADEAYEADLSLEGQVERCRLVSSWRRAISESESQRAIEITRKSKQFTQVRKGARGRPAHLGDLEAICWTPPCESEHASWTVDVWFLTAFDGRVGTGKSFLVDLVAGTVVTVRDFSVRSG
jgi:hypothetical protein